MIYLKKANLSDAKKEYDVDIYNTNINNFRNNYQRNILDKNISNINKKRDEGIKRYINIDSSRVSEGRRLKIERETEEIET